MYATIRTYSGNPGLADALVEHQDEVKEVVGGIDGFNGYYVIKTDDGAATISVYNSQEGTAESTRAAAAWVGENLPQFAGSPPQVTSGEVVISHS